MSSTTHPTSASATDTFTPTTITAKPPLKRVIACQSSVASLAPGVLTWNDVYTRLNAAHASGFDVVHPAISVSITDPAVLAHLSSGGGLQFSIDAAATPSSIFELKVDSLEIELDGASAASPALFWIEHSGHWKMVPRPPNQSSIVEFSLFPHVEVFNCKAAAGKLSASIPAHIELPTFIVPPPIGVAVDSAWVAFSAQAQQPVLTLALAVFGNCAALLRVAYTVHVVIDHGGGGSTTVSTTLKHT